MASVVFLGHVLSVGGISANPEKNWKGYKLADTK